MAIPVTLIRWAPALALALLWALPARPTSEPVRCAGGNETITPSERPEIPFIRRAKRADARASGGAAVDRSAGLRVDPSKPVISPRVHRPEIRRSGDECMHPSIAVHILVVDGYAGCRVGIERVLVELGYRVSSCRTAGEARVVAAAADRFDLLLTEMELPDGHGLELVRHIQQLHPGLRVLFMTHGPTLGPGLLPKPFSLKQLQRAVRRAL